MCENGAVPGLNNHKTAKTNKHEQRYQPAQKMPNASKNNRQVNGRYAEHRESAQKAHNIINTADRWIRDKHVINTTDA